MSRLSISEAASVQFPMVKHATEIGWIPLSPEIAKQKRNGDAGMFLLDDLTERLISLNPGLVTRENVRSIIDRLEALPATIEGNREMLAWMRGERQIRCAGLCNGAAHRANPPSPPRSRDPEDRF